MLPMAQKSIRSSHPRMIVYSVGKGEDLWVIVAEGQRCYDVHPGERYLRGSTAGIGGARIMQGVPALGQLRVRSPSCPAVRRSGRNAAVERTF